MKRPLLTSSFLLLASAFGGCGYTTGNLYNRSVRTVSVPIWVNKTFRREQEFKLTEAIDKNIEYRTPYKIAAQRSADTVLTGEIVDIQEDVLTRRFGTIIPRENQITVIVNFTWRDLRTGRVLVERHGFSRSATEIPQLQERVEDAEQLAIERLASAIVDQMQKEWQTPASAADTQPAGPPEPPPPPPTTSTNPYAPIIPAAVPPATLPTSQPARPSETRP